MKSYVRRAPKDGTMDGLRDLALEKIKMMQRDAAWADAVRHSDAAMRQYWRADEQLFLRGIANTEQDASNDDGSNDGD